jgi:ribosomal protein L13
MKTEPVKKTDISRDWYIFDGKGKILGGNKSLVRS